MLNTENKASLQYLGFSAGNCKIAAAGICGRWELASPLALPHSRALWDPETELCSLPETAAGGELLDLEPGHDDVSPRRVSIALHD